MPAARIPGKLRPLQLAAVIFLTVSGGPYGLESLFSYVGNHGALLLLVLTPLFWDIPTILMVLELNSLMPVTGGYYQWVKHALGLRWAFFEGWWTWLYTFCDLAIYPVLFVGYASFFLPEIAVHKLPICLFIIWSSALLNIIGIVPVGRASMILSIAVLLPFLFVFILSFLHPGAPSNTSDLWRPAGSGAGPTSGFSPFALGLYTVMWNYIGWDNATTYAGEVSRPIRSYVVSVTIALFLAMGIYVLAALAVARSGIDPAALDSGKFPALGVLVGGRWLGVLVAAGGMASTFGLYSAVLLSVSRIPQVMADDRLLPALLCTLHRRFGTPFVSIIASSLIVSILVVFTFSDLVVMDIILYGAGLALEFLALIVLRAKEPDRPRPFRIPLGKKALPFLLLAPVAIYLIALSGAIYPADKGAGLSSGKMFLPVLLGLAMLGSAVPAWWLVRWRNPHLNATASK